VSDSAALNEVYVSYFAASPPARMAIGVVALPKGARDERDAVVAL
jgi:2-iminobutanoate/2-iminopropanoate deaminase